MSLRSLVAQSTIARSGIRTASIAMGVSSALLLAGCSSSSDSAGAAESPSAVVASASAPASVPASPVAEMTGSEMDNGMASADGLFASDARGYLMDMAEELAAFAEGLSAGDKDLTSSNSLDLTFALNQLENLTAPTQIADDWTAGLRKLSSLRDQLTNDWFKAASLSTVRSDIAKIEKQMAALNSLIDQAE